MHGLDSELPTLQHDTALMAYLLDPGEGKYALEDLALRYLQIELQSPDHVEGTLDLDGDAGVNETGRRAAIVLRLVETLEEALHARELVDLYERFELPLDPRAGEDGAGRRPHRRRLPQPARQGAGRPVPPGRSRDPRAGGRDVQRQLHAAAAPDPLREARPEPGEAHQDRPVDRRRLAAEDGGGAPDRRVAAALPGGREAAQHLRRRAPAARARRRPHPRDLQPARDHDRPHLERGAEPPEHPGAHVRRAGAAARVHRRRGQRVAHRRLLADRAARARARRRRPGLDRSVRTRLRHPHHHRGTSVRRRRRRRWTRSTAASPRSSTTGSRTAWRPTASASASTSRPIRPARSSTRTSPRSRTWPGT